MLLDANFSCKKTIKAGALHGLLVKNLQRSLVLKCKNAEQQNQWLIKINEMVAGPGRLFTDLNELPNHSFAPVRKNQLCKWYVNAVMYMQHLMIALNNAKEEIYITDWWMCPELVFFNKLRILKRKNCEHL
jgi:phospholipase D1/2